jgi:8-oxo-dGTP pyrophosphatase MutT (NUDIX family)
LTLPHPSPSAGDLPDPLTDDRAARLEAVLRRHAPADPRESLSLDIMLAELGRLEQPFDETADPTHVTASAIVVGDRGTVLHRHRRLHRWMQPGGHIEPGEPPEESVRRECVEETGLEVAHPVDGPLVVHVDVHGAARGHVHLDLRYLVWGPDEDPAPAPGESQDVAWFSWDQATDMADEALVGGLRTARRLIGSSSGRSMWRG